MIKKTKWVKKLTCWFRGGAKKQHESRGIVKSHYDSFKSRIFGLRGGVKRSVGSRDETNDVAPVLVDGLWNDLSELDIDSVRNDEEITNIALFFLLHDMVKSYNDRVKANVVSLTHLTFVEAVDSLEKGDIGVLKPEQYHCFRHDQNKTILIPVLKNHHFIMIEAKINESSQNEINVFDSMFLENFLTSDEVKQIVTHLNFADFSTVQPHFANKFEIIRQEQGDGKSCGIHVLQNAQAILNNQIRNGPGLLSSYPAQVMSDSLIVQRQLFAMRLEDILGIQNSQPKRRRHMVDDDIVDEDGWIVLSDASSSALDKQIAFISTNRCICTVNIKTSLEKVERIDKLRVTSVCFGKTLRLGDVLTETQSAKNLHGAQNLADLIVVRLTGKYDVDWTSKQLLSNWKEIGICENHFFEVGSHFYDQKIRRFSHVFETKWKGKHVTVCCWPGNGPQPHDDNRLQVQSYISKIDGEKILKSSGLHLPLGLPICNFHKQLVAKMSVQNVISPNLLTGRTPSTSKRIKQNGNLLNLSKTSTPKTRNGVFNRMFFRKSRRNRVASKDDSFDGDVDQQTVRNVEILIEDEFDLIVERMRNILTADIKRLDNETDDMYAMRVLGRVKFHLSKRGERTSEDWSIIDLFPRLHKQFMRGEYDSYVDTDKLQCRKVKRMSKPVISEVSDDEEMLNNSDKEDEPDQYVPGEDLDVQVPNLEELDEDVEKELDDAIADILGHELLTAEQDTRDIAKMITYVRLCKETCPKPAEGDATKVLLALSDFCSISDASERDDVLAQIFTDRTSTNVGMPVKDWIVTFMICYQGLRSLNKRLVELERLSMVRGHIISAKEGSLPDIDKIVNLEFVPDHLIARFNRLYAKKKSVLHHTQPEVEKKFRNLIDAFKTAMENLEDRNCDICSQFTVQSEILRKSAADVEPRFLLCSSWGAQSYDVCRMCWREMVVGRMPHAALVNGMEDDTQPDELKSLNSIEVMLIQRVRAIQNIFHLRNIAGKKVAVTATKGVLTLVPVAISDTVGHVLETLPSASKMTIQVSTPWEKFYLVSMKRILKALEWLKSNNQHYSDIVIDRNFEFELGTNILFENPDKTMTDVQKMILRDKEDDDHLLTQADFDCQPLREMIPEKGTQGLTLESYTMKRDKYRPLSGETPHLDELVFPTLHPKGRYGFSHERTRPTRTFKYTRIKLLQKNRKFAQCPAWYCFMYGVKAQKDLTSVLGIQARLRQGSVKTDVRLDDVGFTSYMSRITAKLRGSPAYWQTVRYDLRSHVANFGNPTFFVTLNSNEKKWTELHALYSKVNGGEVVDGSNINEKIAADPAIYSRYWQRRVNAFFNKVLLVPDGPLGNITHYFRRVEYQHRGTQHVHCLFWTAERPPKDAPPVEYTDFIDKYVTARLPSQTDEPELFAIINENQKHWDVHSPTCTRSLVYRRKKIPRCRFDFPRPELRRTTYYREKCVVGLPGLNKREYFLARDPTDTMINDYNAAISLIWNGNTDVQIISANSTGVCNYVTSYATKGEKAKKLQDSLGMKVSNPQSMSKDTFKVLYNMLSNRECGGLELMDDLLGHRNFAFDRAHTFIPNDHYDKRVRTLKPAAVLEKLQDTDNCCTENMLDDYYPKRGTKLANFSLLNVMINFDVVAAGRAKKPTASKKKIPDPPPRDDSDSSDENEVDCQDDDYHYDDVLSPFYRHSYMDDGESLPLTGTSLKKFRKRKQTVARFFLPELDWNDIETVEDFFRRICVMFIPWDREQTFLEDRQKESYLEAYCDFLKDLRAKSKNAASDMEKIISSFMDLKRQEKMQSRHLEAIRNAMRDLDMDRDMNEEIEVQKRIVDVETHNRAVLSMNAGQEKLFDRIMGAISEQENNKDDSREALRIFVSGTAGVGKSFLINSLADELTLKYTDPNVQGFRPAVLIAAPTGLAAIGVKGSTIHSLFNIEVQHGKDSPFSAMRDDKKDKTKALFSNVKLIIIDELSMCSSVTLLKMHYRLKEIFGSNDFFGNANIVAFGDLLQLPPVLAPCVYEGVSAYQMRQVFGTISMNLNLWDTFEYAELTENMRQREDLEFANLMGRTRLQALTEDDLKVLKTRVIPNESADCKATMDEMAQYFVELQAGDAGALALFPTNVEVAAFNAKVMDLKKMSSIRITATETSVQSARDKVGTKKRKFQKIWQRLEYSLTGSKNKMKDAVRSLSTDESPNIAGGLPLTLDVAVGARVMLRRNLDPPKGLVNGATGELVKIETDANNCVHTLFVKIVCAHIICENSVCIEERRCRNQFPIVMAFGATIHKAQGLTLKNVLISTRNMFCAGQFFVAASRVQNIDGLHLGDLHEEKILVHLKSLVEYNRLRSSIGLDEFLLPAVTDFSRSKNKPADGTVVVKVSKKKSTQKRKIRCNKTEDDLEEIMAAIPEVSESTAFKLSEVQTMHAVLLCIVMMSEIRRGLINLQDDSQMILPRLTLRSLLQGGTQCLDYLLREIREDLSSPAAMFDKCFEFLDDSLKKFVEINMHRRDKCSNCHSENVTNYKTFVLRVVGASRGDLESHISSPFENAIILNERCEKCGIGKVLRKTTYETDAELKYAVVVIDEQQNRFNALRQDGSFFLGRRWQCCAIAYEVGTENQKCCMIANGINMVLSRDITEFELKKPTFANVQILVFEVKEYMRQKKNPVKTTKTKPVPVVYPNLSDDSDNAPMSDCLDSDDDVLPGVETILVLKNTGDDCFLIAAVNVISSMETLAKQILESRGDGIVENLQDLLMKIRNSVSATRKLLPAIFHKGQHDAVTVLDVMLELLPTEFRTSFLVKYNTETKCKQQCTINQTAEDRTFIYWYSSTGQSVASDVGSVEREREVDCVCKLCNGQAKQKIVYSVPSTTTSLLVHRLGVRPDGSGFVNPDVDAIVRLFGRNWRVKAILEYHSMSAQFGSSGHWITWSRKANGQWVKIDDDKIDTVKDSSCMNKNLAVLYVLESL